MGRARRLKELSEAIFRKTVFARMDGIDYAILGVFVVLVLFGGAVVFYCAIAGTH